MAGTTVNQPLSFDPFTASFAKQQPYSEFSPADIYSSLEEFGTDFTTDSAPSPGSPTSPVFANPYAIPTEDWMIWDKLEAPSEHDAFAFLKTEDLGSPILASIPSARSISISPAVNPMDLSNQVQDDVIFGREGISDTQALFQSPQAANLVQSPMSAASPEIKRSPFSSPEPELPSPPKRQSAGAKRHPSRGLKRKSSSSASSPDSRRSSASPAPPSRRSPKDAKQDTAGATAPKKTAHNMIEKRYRTNLNDKIAALRDAVPALRVMVHRLEHGSSGDEGEDEGVAGLGAERRRHIKREVLDEEDLGGLAPAHKLNKATILGKATEYIAHLERRNRSLAKENAALRGRVEGFEMLVMSRGGQQRNVWG